MDESSRDRAAAVDALTAAASGAGRAGAGAASVLQLLTLLRLVKLPPERLARLPEEGVVEADATHAAGCKADAVCGGGGGGMRMLAQASRPFGFGDADGPMGIEWKSNSISG